MDQYQSVTKNGAKIKYKNIFFGSKTRQLTSKRWRQKSSWRWQPKRPAWPASADLTRGRNRSSSRTTSSEWRRPTPDVSATPSVSPRSSPSSSPTQKCRETSWERRRRRRCSSATSTKPARPRSSLELGWIRRNCRRKKFGLGSNARSRVRTCHGK